MTSRFRDLAPSGSLSGSPEEVQEVLEVLEVLPAAAGSLLLLKIYYYGLWDESVTLGRSTQSLIEPTQQTCVITH
jgi:hypothetical protein